jgi:hypothetical protein
MLLCNDGVYYATENPGQQDHYHSQFQNIRGQYHQYDLPGPSQRPRRLPGDHAGVLGQQQGGGFWMANWALHKGQERLSDICLQNKIRFRFFHGQGGSAGRGGGRANQAIFANPVQSRNGRIRFTEQGEVISPFASGPVPQHQRHRGSHAEHGLMHTCARGQA